MDVKLCGDRPDWPLLGVVQLQDLGLQRRGDHRALPRRRSRRKSPTPPRRRPRVGGTRKTNFTRALSSGHRSSRSVKNPKPSELSTGLSAEIATHKGDPLYSASPSKIASSARGWRE